MYKKKWCIVTIIICIITTNNAHINTIDSLSVTVIGTGYVGLVTGAGLALHGHQVICADIDTKKIASLNKGEVPFFEPGLDTLVSDGIRNGNLSFTTQVEEAIKKSDIIFIAVGTPSAPDGSADLSAVHAVIETLIHTIDSYKIIITKSTVPLGTNKKIAQTLSERGISHALFDVVSNPEFLREGSAVYDFLNPDRVVVGLTNLNLIPIFEKLYPCLTQENVPLVIGDTTSAEMIKYASNGFLATKISFINELANLCDMIGADVQIVAHGMGLDKRINAHFLKPGPGFGGSCFPKDTRELLHNSSKHGIKLHTLAAVLQANEIQRSVATTKLKNLLGNDLSQKKIAIFGLAFKANTDDIRDTPALSIIAQLQQEGALINAYDPIAMKNMQTLMPDITYFNDPYEAMKDTDALVILTEWDEFKHIDFARAAKLMQNKYVIDMRNIIDLKLCIDNGFICDAIGRSSYYATLQ